MNKQLVSSDIVGPELLKLLGIDIDNCRKATINIEAGTILTINVEYFAKMEAKTNTDELEVAIKKFSLVEKDEDEC